jgi:hypothetical protein
MIRIRTKTTSSSILVFSLLVVLPWTISAQLSQSAIRTTPVHGLDLNHPLNQLIQGAFVQDRELQRLILNQEVTGLTNQQQDLPSHTPWSIGTGSNGVRLSPWSATIGPEGSQVTKTGVQLTGRPFGSVSLNNDGTTTLQVETPFTIGLSETNRDSITEVSPVISLTRVIEDLGNRQTADPTSLRRIQTQLQQNQSINQRVSAITGTIITGARSIFEEEQNRIQALQDLADAQLARENILVVQRRSPTSLQALQNEDQIALAEFDAANARANQEITLETLRRITGNTTITLDMVLAMELPTPRSLMSFNMPTQDEFTSVELSRIGLDLARETQAQSFEPNAISLTLNASGSATFRAQDQDTLTSSVTGRATFTDQNHWSLGVELGFVTNPRNSGPSFAVIGSYTPGPSRWSSERNQIQRDITSLQLQQAQQALENTLEDTQNSLRDFQTQLRQLELTVSSWERRIGISRASLAQAEAGFQAGITTRTELEKARLNLRSLEIQGRIITLNLMNFQESLNRVKR